MNKRLGSQRALDKRLGLHGALNKALDKRLGLHGALNKRLGSQRALDKALDKRLGLQRGPMGVAPEKWSVKKNIQQQIKYQCGK